MLLRDGNQVKTVNCLTTLSLSGTEFIICQTRHPNDWRHDDLRNSINDGSLGQGVILSGSRPFVGILLAFAPFIVFAVVDRIAGPLAGLTAGAIVALILLARDWLGCGSFR